MVQDQRRRTCVLGRSTIAEIRKDMEELSMPSCVSPAPRTVGSARAGTLGADEWNTLCTVNLPVTLIRLWGSSPAESSKYQMLSNFVDLIIAVKVATQRSITQDEISSYNAYMRRYLETLPALFPGVTFVPNHHLALHLSQNLQDWGPASGTHLFGFERGNLHLRSVQTNNKIGMPVWFHYHMMTSINIFKMRCPRRSLTASA